MKRRLGIAAATVGVWLVATVVIVPATPVSAAAPDFSFIDSFSSGQYNGNDGSEKYDGPWWENQDWGGSNKGAVAVVDGGECPRGVCARIVGEGRMWGAGLARRANIADAATAELQFKYRLAIDEPTDGRLEIAAFDGWNWEILDSIELSNADDKVHSKSYDVIEYAAPFFSIGFLATGEWSGVAYIDDVRVSGVWADPTSITEPSTTATTSTTSTTTSPTTTTSSAPTTTTTSPPSSTTTAPPTTTTAPATTTTTAAPPTTTSGPRAVTTTTNVERPNNANPPVTNVPPTTRPPSTEAPLTDDQRYKDKGAFAFFVFDDEHTTATGTLATMPGSVELPRPGPVTQIVASLTVTAVTVRSHLLSATGLGLLIAVAAVIGLGRHEERTERT